MSDGWIKLHRKFLDWEWWGNEKAVKLFLHLLFKANFEDKKWQGFEIKRGQFLTSIENLSLESNLSIQSTRTILDKFVSTGEIEIKSTNRFTVITVCKYETYQSQDDCANKQLTNNQQTTNKQLTTTKELKNIRIKENKIIYAEFVSMKETEFEKLKNELGEADAKRAIEILNNYKGSTGKKYKSDYLAIHNWVITRLQSEKKNKTVEVSKDKTYSNEWAR